MSTHQQHNITVLGAGVIGLTAALSLSRRPNYSITLIAKHMPGDYDIEYASPWAGANYLPLAAANTPEAALERDTWPALSLLATSQPEAGVHFQTARLFSRKKDSVAPEGADPAVRKVYESRSSATPWFAEYMPEFRSMQGDELRGYDSGTTFRSVVINTALYLPWLASECLKNGVVIRRGIVGHVKEASELHHDGKADLVVNCTGLGARTLGGVCDSTMFPARGQIVVVRNDPGELTSTSGTDDGPEESCYAMHRAAGGGTVLGGCYQKGSWESAPDPNLAVRIMTRAVQLVPKLTDGRGIEKLSVIRHAVGLRPVREGGTRIEKELIDDLHVVHCYGHGGYGYQASWGSASVVVGLVQEALS